MKDSPIAFIEIQASRFDRRGKLIVSNCYISQIMVVRVEPDGSEDAAHWMTNPLQVDPGADFQEYQVNDTPFRDIAAHVREFLDGCDLAGFGIRRLDLPLLAEEFARSGFHDFPADWVKVIDVQSIFHQMERRDFQAAVKFYLGKDYDGDRKTTDATLTRLIHKQQTEMYSDIPTDRQELHDMCVFGKNIADFSGLIYWDDTAVNLFWNFGKLKDQRVRASDAYTEWFLKNDFPYQSKRIVAEHTDMYKFLHLQNQH